jgi:hypothetical protein
MILLEIDRDLTSVKNDSQHSARSHDDRNNVYLSQAIIGPDQDLAPR